MIHFATLGHSKSDLHDNRDVQGLVKLRALSPPRGKAENWHIWVPETHTRVLAGQRLSTSNKHRVSLKFARNRLFTAVRRRSSPIYQMAILNGVKYYASGILPCITAQLIRDWVSRSPPKGRGKSYGTPSRGSSAGHCMHTGGYGRSVLAMRISGVIALWLKDTRMMSGLKGISHAQWLKLGLLHPFLMLL